MIKYLMSDALFERLKSATCWFFIFAVFYVQQVEKTYNLAQYQNACEAYNALAAKMRAAEAEKTIAELAKQYGGQPQVRRSP